MRSFSSLSLLGLAAASALAAAYTAQYGFNLQPCELCLFQRPAFYAVILLSVIGLFWKKPQIRPVLLALVGVVMLANSGIAFYHTGVEKKWWPGPDACTSGEIEANLSLEELRAQILAAPLVRCDEPAWQFHGITMAGMNVVYCLGLAMFAFWSLRHALAQNRTQS